jgi:imidazolonepropionase-like amidohydrolase
MSERGVEPVDALRAATRNSAELLGKLDQIGTIELGKTADLVLCRGDAVADVTRLTDQANIQAVIQAGRIVHQS